MDLGDAANVDGKYDVTRACAGRLRGLILEHGRTVGHVDHGNVSEPSRWRTSRCESLDLRLIRSIA